MTSEQEQSSGIPPDPRGSNSVDEFVYRLGETRSWAGQPSTRELARRVNRRRRDRSGTAAKVPHSTVSNCFQPGRRHLDYDLVFDLLRAMAVPEDCLEWWRETWRTVFPPRDPTTIVTVDRTLPPEAVQFTGRLAELAQLTELAAGAGNDRPGVVVLISGMPGVGKTELGVRAARQLVNSGQFDEAQLYVNLRGYDPTQARPAQPAAVLEGLLRALDHRGAMPVRLESRLVTYRNRLASKRVLILLDNVAHEDQIRDLLPEIPGTMVIVTSRSSLAGLKGIDRIPLDVLTEDESIELLRRTAGAHHAEAPAVELASIAHVCGNLPLALRLTAAYLGSHPDVSLSDHTEHRAELGIHNEVQMSLTVSYDGLHEDTRAPFRLLALHPGGHVTPHAVAALADVDLVTGQRLLSTLFDNSLLQTGGPGRYQFHDLIRGFATGLTKRDDVPSRRRAALSRLLNHYRSTAATAMNLVAGYEIDRRPPAEVATTPPIEFADRTQAQDWLETERENLCATIECAATDGWHDYTNKMAQTLFRYFIIGGYHTEALVVHGHAVDAARAEGDQFGEGTALRNLGISQWLRGQPHLAVESITSAIVIFDDIDDTASAGRAHNSLGLVYQSLGDQGEAEHHHELALAKARDTDDQVAEGDALGNLAVVYWRLGRYDDAFRNLEQNLATAELVGDPDGFAIALGNTGEVHQRLGRYQQAVEHHQRSLSIYVATNNRPGQASAHTNLGTAQEHLGQFEEALASHRHALALYTEMDEPEHRPETQAAVILTLQRLGRVDEAAELLTGYFEPYHPADSSLSPIALNRFAEALRIAGRWTEATQWYQSALRCAQDNSDRYEQARALDGIAHTLNHSGDQAAARQCWQSAFDLYSALGVPDAEQIRAAMPPTI